MPKHAANVPDGTPSEPADQIEGTAIGEQGEPAESADSSESVSVDRGEHAGGFAYQGDNDGEYPDALESLEPKDAPPLLFGEDVIAEEPEPVKGRHGKNDMSQIPPHQHKSRRMRRVLIIVVILLIALIVALGYFTFRLFTESQTLATQQTREQQDAQEVTAIQEKETKDATTTTEKKTDVPDLSAILGMTQDQALTSLAHGATVVNSKDVNEEGNAIKKDVTVALTDEPADARSTTPTVYLGLNAEGLVVQVGYSAATSALGYGSLSFVDAVRNEHIVEKTLNEAGIPVPEGSAVLPDDKTTYSTYASDGTTLVKENCSFSGTVDLDGTSHEWSAVLLYDYTTANTSGNLADTIRMIYVYINA